MPRDNMGTRGTPRDLSQQAGNPTSALQAQYQQLMTIQDPAELMQAATKVVQPLVGKGMSEKNWRKFQKQIKGAARKGLTGLQMFLTNYILKGSGQGVIGGGGGRFAAESASIAEIANVITEDANIFRELSPQQQYLKNLIEDCTNFKVILLEARTREWLQEAYGYEDEAGESLDEELYGIRETLKNALANGNLAYKWGDLGMRIRGLEQKGVDRKLLGQAVTTYEQLTAATTKGYHKARDMGANEPTVHDRRAGKIVRKALKEAHYYFKPLQEVLSQMSSQSSQHLGHVMKT